MTVAGTMGVEAPQAERNGTMHRMFPGRLVFYHPNGKGTGSAFRMELKLNRPTEDRYGCFFVEMARQKSVADRSQSGTAAYARFDWENKVTIKLGFLDVCAMLQVLEERAERLGQDGKGLYHQNGSTNTLITLQRSATSEGCYLGVSRKDATAKEASKVGFLLNDRESIGLRCVLQAGLFHIAFCETEVGGSS